MLFREPPVGLPHMGSSFFPTTCSSPPLCALPREGISFCWVSPVLLCQLPVVATLWGRDVLVSGFLHLSVGCECCIGAFDFSEKRDCQICIISFLKNAQIIKKSLKLEAKPNLRQKSCHVLSCRNAKNSSDPWAVFQALD